MDDRDADVLPGRRPVLEALLAGRPLRKILIARGVRPGGTIRAILQEARRRDVVVQFVAGQRLADLAVGSPHQGVVAFVSAKAFTSVEEILATARTRQEAPFVLVLDGVESPANLGAVLRTAEGAGVHGVIIPRHRAVGLTPAVAKASSGAIEYVPVAQVTNVARTLEGLKEAGLWVVGADPNAHEVYHRMRLVPPLALVMGGEGRGLGRVVKEHCDGLVRLPMRGRISSLNVAVAAGVLLYEVRRQQAGSEAASSPPEPAKGAIGGPVKETHSRDPLNLPNAP